MNKQESQQIKKILQKTKRDKEVIAVLIFGSSLKNKYYKDIDICLVLNKKHSNLKIYEKRLNLLKELPDNFDIQIFQQLPIYIKIEILKEMKILLCKDYDSLYEIAFQTIKEFDDFKEIYENYIKNALK